MFSNILLATDLSGCSDAATDTAVELAKKFDGKLTVLHVYEIPAYAYAGGGYVAADLLSPLQKVASTALAELLKKVQARVPTATSMLGAGNPAAGILETAREAHPDLIVMGTHGRRGASHLFLGSVAERVVQRSKCPVLTIPPHEAP